MAPNFFSQVQPDCPNQPRIDFSYHKMSGTSICSLICGQISQGQIFISWSNFWGQIRMNMIPLFTVCRKNTVNFCMWNEFWNIKIWLQTESNENEWKAVLSLLRSILHRICNELWIKLLSLTQNPVCVSNIPQENEASVNKKTCLSFTVDFLRLGYEILVC